MKRSRIAILDGVRTPFCKAGGALKDVAADDLGALVVRELLARTCIPATRIDELVFGNVAQPAHAANIARVISRKAGLPDSIVASTVHHNCASGIRAVTAAALDIQCGEARVVVAGGTESMSRIPLIYGEKMTAAFARLYRARKPAQRLAALASIRPSHVLRPVVALEQGLTDPICEMNMGQTAEVLAREFRIGRAEQDAFALASHRKASAAADAGRLAEEIVPVIGPPAYDRVQTSDTGPRPQQSMEQLGALRPYFDRHAGTVTVGNACPVTDGAAAVVLAGEDDVEDLGVPPLGWITGWAYAGLDGQRMGLGPVYATARLLDRTGLALRDFDAVEMNEAFAAQVLANLRAFASERFAAAHLGRADGRPVGELDEARLNPNGGAIALGHPVGATGTRLILTALRELKRRGGRRALATLCVGGGQGAAIALEAA